MKLRNRPLVAALLGAIGVTFLTLMAVNGHQQAQVTERRAVAAAKVEAKKEVGAQVDNKIGATVNDQLDRRLLPNTVTTPPTLPPSQMPGDIYVPTIPPTTTTLPGPFDLTTTTTQPTVTTLPPVTTTSLEVPTTVPVPTTLPPLP